MTELDDGTLPREACGDVVVLCPEPMRFYRPRGVLSGFDANSPDPDVPEVAHAGEQWLPSSYPIGSHRHEVFELYLQLDGVSLWESRRRRYEVRPKGFLLVPPRVEHALVNRRTGKHHFLFAAIDVKSVLARLPEVGVHYAGDTCRAVADAESLEAPFRQLLREVTTRAPYRATGLRAAVDLLVIEAARQLAGDPAEPLVACHPGVMAAKNVLQRRSSENWSLVALSKLAGLSPSHLTALFVHEVGLSPHQYLLGERIRRAKELLRGTDRPVTELALELGFSSSQHFAKMFKRVAGTTALEYRRGRLQGST
jgi:AraC-like DNA-binding protein